MTQEPKRQESEGHPTEFTDREPHFIVTAPVTTTGARPGASRPVRSAAARALAHLEDRSAGAPAVTPAREKEKA